MNKFFSSVFILLRKYNRLWIVNLSLFAAFAFVIAAILLNVTELTSVSIFLFLMCTWEISNVFLFEKRAIIENDLADAKDKLCLAEHEVDRLKFELNTLQAVLKEEERQREQSGKETDSDTEQKPKPKRPAFKRKPKPKTENPDENKN